MAKGRGGAAGVLMMLVCSAPANAGMWQGEPTFVDAEIDFVYEDNRTPVGVDDVVIVESLNNSVLVTERTRTDKGGRVRLRGVYCLPMAVGVVGGFADVHAEYLKDQYTVFVKRSSASHDKELGRPDAIVEKNIIGIRRTCRF
ncbi:MAG: hypothetical protein U1E53_28360 [Dongiaceae bacterium]